MPFIAHHQMLRIEQSWLKQNLAQHYTRSLVNSEQKVLITDFGFELKTVSSCPGREPARSGSGICFKKNEPVAKYPLTKSG